MLKGSAKKKTIIGGTLLAAVIGTLLIVANYRLPTHDGRSVEQWFGELTSEDATVRTRAEEAMQSVGPASIPFLLSQVSSGRPTFKAECLAWAKANLLRERNGVECGLSTVSETWSRQQKLKSAFGLLGKLATPAIPKLTPLLSDPICQHEAAFCLAIIGTEGVAVMGAQLGSTNETTRRCIVSALGETKEAREEAAYLLLKTLKDGDPLVRHYSAFSLGAVHMYPKESVQALTAALKDPEAKVRYISVYALGKFESDAIAALDALRALKGDPEESVRKAASEVSLAIEGSANLGARR